MFGIHLEKTVEVQLENRCSTHTPFVNPQHVVLVVADDKSVVAQGDGAAFHEFGIKAEGETLTLVSPDFSRMDQVSFAQDGAACDDAGRSDHGGYQVVGISGDFVPDGGIFSSCSA